MGGQADMLGNGYWLNQIVIYYFLLLYMFWLFPSLGKGVYTVGWTGLGLMGGSGGTGVPG